MAFRVQTTDQTRNTGVKVLVYGKAGMGKTTLCATAPRPFILSAESGLLSLRKYRIPYAEIKTLADLDEALLWAYNPSNMQHFDTLCLDSVSEILEVAIGSLKKGAADPRQSYGKLVDDYLPKLRQFRDLPGKHVVLTAKLGSVKDEVSGAVLYGPDAPGRELPKQLPYLVDEVFYLGSDLTPQGQPYRFLRTAPNYQFEAKDRSGSLAELEPPNLATVFNKIMKG